MAVALEWVWTCYGYGRITARATSIPWLEQRAYRSYRYGCATGVYIRATAADVHIIIANNTTDAITTTTTGLLRALGLRSV